MKLTAFLAALLLGTTAQAQQASATATTSSGWTFALHGFTSMSTGYQTGQFCLSEGQQSLCSATGASPVNDKNSWTADVRQSRFNFSVKGPQVLGGATPTGVLEIDFMQGFGAGNYGDVSLLNRMRLAYTELNWGNTRLQLGQQNDLSFAMVPTSLSHIAFPIGYFTGNIGWRRPGVFAYQTLTVAPDTKVELAGEVGRAQWADASAAGTNGNAAGGAAANQPGGINLGEASGGPAYQGRVTLRYSKYLTALVGGHFQNTDLTGYNNAVTPAPKANTVQTIGYLGGLKLELPLPSDMGLVVQGTGFTGQNLAPLIVNFTTAGTAFNIGLQGQNTYTTGWWAQAGLNFTKELSLWGFYGQQTIDNEKTYLAATPAAGGTAYANATTNVILMYREGGLAFSVEWIDFSTKYATGVAGGALTGKRTSTADQYLFTTNYYF